MEQDTTISITDTGTNFQIGTTQGNGTAIYGVSVSPEGTTFYSPITITFAWADEDGDGKVDGTNVRERDLIIFKDGDAISGRCEDDLYCDMEADTFQVQVSSLSEFSVTILHSSPEIIEMSVPSEPIQFGAAANFTATFKDPCPLKRILSFGNGVMVRPHI